MSKKKKAAPKNFRREIFMNTGTRTHKSAKDYSRSQGKKEIEKFLKTLDKN